jgi:hypothetical protein
MMARNKAARFGAALKRLKKIERSLDLSEPDSHDITNRWVPWRTDESIPQRTKDIQALREDENNDEFKVTEDA